MSLNYAYLRVFKGYFLQGASVGGSAASVYLATNLIPGIVMGRTYKAASTTCKTTLGPLAPYCTGTIDNASKIAAAEAYIKLKNTGYFGWTFSAVTKAISCGALVGSIIGEGICKGLKEVHTIYVEKDYNMKGEKIHELEGTVSDHEDIGEGFVNLIKIQEDQRNLNQASAA